MTVESPVLFDGPILLYVYPFPPYPFQSNNCSKKSFDSNVVNHSANAFTFKNKSVQIYPSVHLDYILKRIWVTPRNLMICKKMIIRNNEKTLRSPSPSCLNNPACRFDR